MSAKKSKILRKIANLTGRTDSYIKREYKGMDPILRRGYISFMKENFARRQELIDNPPPEKDTVILDTKI